MQKGFAPILILVGILVALALAGGVYFFGKSQVAKLQNPVVVSQTPQATPTPSSTSDETASWKTYTNTKYGYSIWLQH